MTNKAPSNHSPSTAGVIDCDTDDGDTDIPSG